MGEPQGDFELLAQSMAAMNVECANIGKMLFSDGPDQLAVVACLPDVLASVLTCEDWLHAVKHEIGGTLIESTSTSGKLVVHAGADAYPIKLKETGITAAIRVLKERGLFANENDDDELVFGDDDYPSA